MKGVFCIVLFSILCSGYHSMAQHTNVGLKGGINANDMNVTLETLVSNYQVGVYGYYAVNKRLTFQGEVNYISKSFDKSEERWDVSGVQLPLLLKYKLYNPIFVQTGIQYNLVASVKRNDEVLDNKSFANYYSTFLGIGIGLPSGFEFSTRYYFWDFSNQNTSSPLMTSVVQVSLGFDIY